MIPHGDVPQLQYPQTSGYAPSIAIRYATHVRPYTGIDVWNHRLASGDDTKGVGTAAHGMIDRGVQDVHYRDRGPLVPKHGHQGVSRKAADEDARFSWWYVLRGEHLKASLS